MDNKLTLNKHVPKHKGTECIFFMSVHLFKRIIFFCSCNLTNKYEQTLVKLVYELFDKGCVCLQF